MVIQSPRPDAPQLMNSPESRGRLTRPAPCSAYDTEPEQSYPESLQLPWPPPYLYGFVAISLPASMTCLTASGASGGATARPSLVIRALPLSVGSVGSTGSSVVASAAAALIARASRGGTTPFTRRSSARSKARTLPAVLGPKAPSAVVGKPARVR